MDDHETGIALLWDSAPLWSLLVWRALRDMGVPCVPLKPLEIAQGGLSDKRLLLVPGGSARQKFTALGPEGREAVRDFVAGGGWYLGFCGGAGLGLTGDDGLGLCPWRRAEFQDRLPHLLSGHVPVLFTEHAFASSLFSSNFFVPHCDETVCHLPVWWPGRFQPDETYEAAGRVRVLARYFLPPGYEAFPSDMMVADLSLSRIPGPVLDAWREEGVELPPHLHNTPCVVQGTFGKGEYVLSYSHLETPDSPLANRWLASFLEGMGGVVPRVRRVPQWEPEAPAASEAPAAPEALVVPEVPDNLNSGSADAILLYTRNAMRDLLQLAQEHDLMFPRTPWLVGWRAGTPGSALNTLHLVLSTLAAAPLPPKAEAVWAESRKGFAACAETFLKEAEWWLLTQRLSGTLSTSESVGRLAEQVRRTRVELFGTAMRGGGLYQTLLDFLEPVLFEVVRQTGEHSA